jgi:coenzyme PQQ precursor peptide PqqA
MFVIPPKLRLGNPAGYIWRVGKTAARGGAAPWRRGSDCIPRSRRLDWQSLEKTRRQPMAWTRPILREICIGMEINGYFAARM